MKDKDNASFTLRRQRFLVSAQKLVRDLIRLWRVWVPMVACKVIASNFGHLMRFTDSESTNPDIAGVLALGLGFGIGLPWHLANAQRRSSTSLAAAILLGVVSMVSCISHLCITVPRARDEMRRLESLRALNAARIRRILVFDRYGEKIIVVVNDRVPIKEFTDACRDAEPYSPDHPGYYKTWYVVLEGSARHELTCSLVRQRPSQVVGAFVHKEGSRTWGYGNFASTQLRRWFQKHVTGRTSGDVGAGEKKIQTVAGPRAPATRKANN